MVSIHCRRMSVRGLRAIASTSIRVQMYQRTPPVANVPMLQEILIPHGLPRDGPIDKIDLSEFSSKIRNIRSILGHHVNQRSSSNHPHSPSRKIQTKSVLLSMPFPEIHLFLISSLISDARRSVLPPRAKICCELGAKFLGKKSRQTG